MKKILLPLMVAAMAMTACKPTVEDRANALIEKHTRHWLINPDSYEKISTEIDSAFTPYCDKAFHKEVLNWQKFDNRIKEVKEHMAEEERLGKQWKAEVERLKKLKGAKAKKELKIFEQEYEMHLVRMKKMDESIGQIEEIKGHIAQWIKEKLNQKHEFMGYQVIHRHASTNQEGKREVNNMYYLLDKDLKRIIIVLNADSPEFKEMMELIKKEDWM